MREIVGMLIQHRREDLDAPIAIQIDEGIGRPSLDFNQRLILIFLLPDDGLPLAGGFLAVLRDHFLHAPSQQWLGTVWFSTGENGVASQHPHAAFSMTGETLTLCYAIWKRPEDDAANVAWHREMMNHLDPFAVGHYVGESDIVSFPVRHERSFASANWQRLEWLRREWDPDGLFHGPFCAP